MAPRAVCPQVLHGAQRRFSCLGSRMPQIGPRPRLLVAAWGALRAMPGLGARPAYCHYTVAIARPHAVAPGTGFVCHGEFGVHQDEHGDGFTAYVSTIRPRLRRKAFLLCGDWHEADDLVQDTFVALYRRWPQLARHDELDRYTHTVLVRTFVSLRRRLRWRREILCSEPPDRAQGREDAEDLRLSMLARLRRLPPRQRAVVVLRFWEDLSIEQTAAALRISPGTVASQSYKALAALRGSLAGLQEDSRERRHGPAQRSRATPASPR
jgi:RNA polymerase sigma-70 factor (sigma-E family)